MFDSGIFYITLQTMYARYI